MATFDTATYPLSAETGFDFDSGDELDIMDDRTPRLRTLTTYSHAELRCVFRPMSDATSAAFQSYLISVSATELDITHNGTTYRGFIRPQSWSLDPSQTLNVWTLTFYGRVV